MTASKEISTCRCGCGAPTSIATQTSTSRGWIAGEPLQFVRGHNSKTNHKADPLEREQHIREYKRAWKQRARAAGNPTPSQRRLWRVTMLSKPGARARLYAEWRRRYLSDPEFRRKRDARQKVSQAVFHGRISRGPCADCGTREKTHGHHEDYDKALAVTWLCRRCHTDRHTATAQGS